MSTRTEYAVFIPDAFLPGGRREVRRYPDRDPDGDGAELAAEHVVFLHRVATPAGRRAEAYAVEQVITVEETPLAASPERKEEPNGSK